MSNWWNFDLTYGIPINFGAEQNTETKIYDSLSKKVVIYNYVVYWFYFIIKSVIIALNYFFGILWNFIVLGLVLSLWKIKHKMKISAVMWLACKKFARKVFRKGHIRNTCWKLKSQVSGYILQVLHETGHFTRYSWNSLPKGF